MIEIFVYGTLKRGYANHHLLAEAQYVGRVVTSERFPLSIAGAYYVPVLLKRSGQGHRVQGELYRVDAATLQALDELEGVACPEGYERDKIAVEFPSLARRIVDVYFKREPAGPLHTDWLQVYEDRRYVSPQERR